jgi:hypothetical protein
MRLRPQPLPPVPEATAAAVHAAFPKGHLSVELRAEFGRLYDDQLFADRYPPQGRPVGSAIHVMLQSQNHAQPSLLFNRLWNGIGSPALHG